MWDFTTSPTLKFCCCFSVSQRSRCAVFLSFIIICYTDIANWEFVHTSRKYLNNTWFLSGFKFSVGNNYLSRGNLYYIPTAATLRITSVSSIGALFHVYWGFFSFSINTSRLTKSCPAIAYVLFRNQWYFSTLFTLWMPRAKCHNIIWGHLYIYSKAPLNRISASTTTTANIPNDNTTYSINNLYSDSALVYFVMENIMNCVKSHISLSRWHPSWLLCSAVPGDHISRCII